MLERLDLRTLETVMGAYVDQLETHDLATVGISMSQMLGVPTSITSGVLIEIMTESGTRDEKIKAGIKILEGATRKIFT